MTTQIEIKAQERGAIRVFAVNKAPGEVAEALKTLPKPDLARRLLGNPHLDTSTTEIFPMSDLTGMGLSAYLTEGYAVEDAQIAPDRNKLDALEGYVLLLFSDSFAGTDVTLKPGGDLTLIGTYTEYTPPAAGGSIATESAKPYSGATGKSPQPGGGKGSGSAVIVLGIIALLVLGLWWILG
ncbi:hypothetical protein [uncultured Roseobacter sp.]|uniref:hypothetical protein n=1 Tax=uncultured Roseobacter sp. TaxID=114847 RepID=UPI002628D6B8|nr:hypothetical protein [uncultured Roseobacter sp.]